MSLSPCIVTESAAVALLCRMSIHPNRASAVSAVVWIEILLAASHTTATALPPSSRMPEATAFAASRFLSTTTMAVPS